MNCSPISRRLSCARCDKVIQHAFASFDIILRLVCVCGGQIAAVVGCVVKAGVERCEEERPRRRRLTVGSAAWPHSRLEERTRAVEIRALAWTGSSFLFAMGVKFAGSPQRLAKRVLHSVGTKRPSRGVNRCLGRSPSISLALWTAVVSEPCLDRHRLVAVFAAHATNRLSSRERVLEHPMGLNVYKRWLLVCCLAGLRSQAVGFEASSSVCEDMEPWAANHASLCT